MNSVSVRPIKIFHIIGPFQQFVKKVVTGGFLLFATAVFSLAWANFSPDSYAHFWHIDLSISLGPYSITKSLVHWIDEALMTLFFFTVGLEIKREVLVGELASVKKALLPVSAACGGMIFPAAIYLLLNFGTDAAHGWGIPMATDIAFALAVLSLLGRRVPFGVRIFLSALAIADDLGAVVVIALFYTKTINMGYLLISLVFLVALGVANWLWLRHTLLYALLGLGLWFFILGSGIHATVAGVIVALFIPARAKYDTDTFIRKVSSYLEKFRCENGECGHTILLDQSHLDAVQSIEFACHQTETPLQRLEHGLNSWVAYIVLPLFALANAGVALEGVNIMDILASNLTLGVILGLLVGKPLGIFFFTFATVKIFKINLIGGINWGHILGASVLGGIGFTMSIFISGLSFPDMQSVELSKFGIVAASFVSSLVGVTILMLSSRGVGNT